MMDATVKAGPGASVGTGSGPAIAFGPVPSRRLGRSIGINHIPPKTCSYACVYCQVGRTSRLRTARCAFYAEDDIVAHVQQKVAAARAAGEEIDYLTFVPDGEPALDISLPLVIERLRPLGIKIAVISNGSLLWRTDVRAALAQADWVSVKVDAVRPDVWRRINRPHRSLWLDMVLDGMMAFAEAYRGELATETMLVRGVNDDAAHLADLAAVLAQLRPAKAYLSVPTRPPAEPWVEPPPEDAINQAYQLVRAQVAHVELLIGYEGNAFAATGDVKGDLLSITAVHPMREDAVQDLLARTGAEMSIVDALVEEGRLVRTTYESHRFYARNLHCLKAHPLPRYSEDARLGVADAAGDAGERREIDMCQAKVYLGDQEIDRDVIWLEPVAEGVRYAKFFGELHLVKGRLQRIDFLTHRVVLTPLEEDRGRDHEATHAAPALD